MAIVIRVQAAVRQYTWLTIRASRPVAVAFRVAVAARGGTATERLLVATGAPGDGPRAVARRRRCRVEAT